uniref:Tubulin like n=1 Tax=Candidatus Kentrum sp. MB TaxID=2138164 RepID=A0A450XA96_9GAMM|nr:MAG: Tubulin like [Candidatus Kentron sp. MB]
MGALFIGIGGTGDWILTHLKDKVHTARGETPDEIQFRLIDTLAPDYRINSAARLGERVGITDSEYLQLADNPPGSFVTVTDQVVNRGDSIPQVSRWFQAAAFRERLPKADFNLARGAGQHRQFGRMGVYLNRQQIATMVRKALESCRRQDGEIPIWILTSVAGGTGAGIFSDVAALARLAAQEMGIAHRILGVAVLPEVYKDVKIDEARAYAVMRELERLQAPVHPDDFGRQTGREGTAYRFKIPYDGAAEVLLDGPLFDNLIFYNRPCGNETQRRSYFSQIADGLNLLLEEGVGDALFSQWINVEEGFAASFNSHRVFLPARIYERQFIRESMLAVVEGLLPRDRDSGVLIFGSEHDRTEDAKRILLEEGFPLFSQLIALDDDDKFKQFGEKMNAYFIVNTLFGFANPQGVFRQDIGDKANQAKALCRSLCEGIENYRDAKESHDDSKTRVLNEVTRRRTVYEGDGEKSFQVALQGIRGLLDDRLVKTVDDNLKGYLGAGRAGEQALGRAIKVFKESKIMLGRIRENLGHLTRNDAGELERLRGEETDARVAMDETKKPFLGKGQLPNRQDDYFDAVNRVAHWWQRMRLRAFMDDLLKTMDDRYDQWLRGLGAWEQTLDQAGRDCRNALSEIDQELERQTEISSSSLGPKNTRDMDGYQAVLRARCSIDTTTGTDFAAQLLNPLRWQGARSPNTVLLEGWVGGETIDVRKFPEALYQHISESIRERMRDREGMANYLEWLRDEKKADIDELVGRLKQVADGFVDGQPTSGSRKFVLLYGDVWQPNVNQGRDQFLNVYNELNKNPTFKELENNLRTGEGRNLFEDRNVLAILGTDKEIRYQDIPVVNAMRNHYLDIRIRQDNEWRVDTYHIFRCEQEIWRLEQQYVLEKGDNTMPLVSGAYYRVLDEPDRVELFAKALVAGVVREIDTGLDGKVWGCGPDTDDSAIYLTAPKQDLFRALLTFVQDKKDRRPEKTGTLESNRVRDWINAALKASGQSLDATVQAFRAENPTLFEHEMAGGEYADPRKAFLALILDYYLQKI